MSVIAALGGSPPTASQCANHDRYGLVVGPILAFSERLLLAINGRERAFRLRPLSGVKRTCQNRCLLFRVLRLLSEVKQT